MNFSKGNLAHAGYFSDWYLVAGDLRKPNAARGCATHVERSAFLDSFSFSLKGQSRAGCNHLGLEGGLMKIAYILLKN